MQEKEAKFTSLFMGNMNQLNALLEQIVANELKHIIGALEEYEANSSLVQESFYTKLIAASKVISEIITFDSWLNKYGIDITQYLHSEFNNSEPVSVEEVQTLVNLLIERQQPVEKEVIPNDALTIYKEFFGSKEERLPLVSITDLQKKKRYLDYLWYLSSNTSLKNMETALEQAKVQSEKLKELEGNLKSVSSDYRTELNRFRNRVIKDIEIPFYLYSARIIQNYQRGLGLFIHGDDGQELKSIKFLSDLNSSHDALFSLSSGQLTALVIAFSLALNKIYSENSLLLIDDPTQTMDEINVASLVELLRNEFGDRQILLSTHEDHTSMYLRYKFQKYGKETKRINLKEAAFLNRVKRPMTWLSFSKMALDSFAFIFYFMVIGQGQWLFLDSDLSEVPASCCSCEFRKSWINSAF